MKRKPQEAGDAEVERMIAARKQAEAVVADMPDGDLKSKAFEVAYQQALSNRTTTNTTRLSGRRSRKGTSPVKRSRAEAVQRS